MNAPRPGRLSKISGTGSVPLAALALLVLGCVFVAMAGPRESQATRTQALRQTLGSLAPAVRVVQANADWHSFSDDMAHRGTFGSPTATPIDPAQLADVTGQLHAELAANQVMVAPSRDDWAGLTVKPNAVLSPVPPAADPGGPSTPPQLELAYRSGLGNFAPLVAGKYPGQGSGSALQAVVSSRTAALFGLHPGSALRLAGDGGASVTVLITGIVRPASGADAFWTADNLLSQPTLQVTTNSRFWIGAVMVGDQDATALQSLYTLQDMTLSWELPVDTSRVGADQAQTLADALTGITKQNPTLRGAVAGGSPAMSLNSPLIAPLNAFISTQSQVQSIAWMLFVSLAIIGAAVLLLAARLLAASRAAEYRVLRARGASMWQVGWHGLRGALAGCVPAAALGALLAVLLTPGGAAGPAAAWWLAGVVLAAALAGSAIGACVTVRRPGGQRTGRRLVAETALILAAIAGLVVFRKQAPGQGIDLYSSAAPVLLALPAALVVARIYPFVVRGLLKLATRLSGAPGFIALATAAKAGTMTAVTLVLAVTVAAFGGMVRDAITTGQVAASWRAVGADYAISTTANATITPAAERAIAAVPGVRAIAPVWSSSWIAPGGTGVTGIAVDPAGYAAYLRTAPGWPRIQPAALAADGMLLSSSAAAAAGGGTITFTSTQGLPPLRAHVTGTVSSTPALPSGSPFFIVPAGSLLPKGGPPQWNAVLLTGDGINPGTLDSVVRHALPGAVILARSAAFEALANAPLQHGANLIFLLAIAAAAGFALVALALDLALGTAGRELMLARLTAMGLAPGQRARLAIGTALPGLVAAAATAAGCAIALPKIIGSALDLSVFTGPGGAVRVTPGVTAFALPLGALLLLAVGTLAIQARWQRAVAARLRIGG